MRLISSIMAIMVTVIAWSEEISVLQWNIWQEGTVVPQGYSAIVDEIERLSPDFVTLSEVRNYNDVDFTARLVDDLSHRGVKYYTVRSVDSGFLSRFPIESMDVVYPLGADHGSVYRLRTVTPEGNKVALYTAHLDYLNCAYYDVRGYSGNDWSKCDIPSSVEEILRRNVLSRRDDAAEAIINRAREDESDGYIVIVGGDFNEPSHLDWTEKTSNIRDHAGFSVPWTVSTMLEKAGFVDSYRVVYPDPIANPGFTFPTANTDMDVKRLTWAPESDERDRIDFVYYKSSNKAVNVKGAYIHGPAESIERSVAVADGGKDRFILPLGVWPTDHKGVYVSLAVD